MSPYFLSWPLVASALLALCGCGQDEPSAPQPAAGAPHPSVALAWPVVVERGVEPKPEYERVVLVTIDTLRADHVSCYGYPRATTPFLDSLAARGVRFERAMAAISHTAPSHATMLTGLVPAVHGVLRNGNHLDGAALDAARLLGGAGFESAAFLNANFLTAVAGSFGKVVVRGAGGKHPHSGKDVVDAAVEWLQGERKQPRFFLWVHLYDPHEWQARMHFSAPGERVWSGETPADFRDQLLALHGLPPFVEGKPYAVQWGKDRPADERVQDSTLETLLRGIDHYDELVHFADTQVAHLHAALEALALPGRTLWIVTADHGEGLASHQTTGHGDRIFQEQLHVPLILHASDGSLGPRVVRELVGHIDLLPTLGETLGLRVRGDPRLFEGRSLLPLVRGDTASWGARPLFAQRRPAEAKDQDSAAVYALQDSDHKILRTVPGDEQVFDLGADPRELHSKTAEEAAAAELRAGLDARLRTYQGLDSGEPQEASPEFLEELKSLGYL